MILDARGGPVEVEPIPEEPARDPFGEHWLRMLEASERLRRAERNARQRLPLDYSVTITW
jgi:hypothetical protein